MAEATTADADNKNQSGSDEDDTELQKLELRRQVSDKGREVQDILQKYSSTVGAWHETEMKQKEPVTEKVFAGCETVIMILGNLLNPDGSPHEWILQRIEHSFNLLKEKNLDLSTTCFMPSGGDVSNQKYTYDADKWKDVYKNAPHPTEATVMRDLLNTKYKVPLGHIVRESQARTTLENFYYGFKILYNSRVKSLKNFFLVTSDWHTRRARVNFDILYKIEKELEAEMEVVGDIITRKYQIKRWFECENIEFVGAVSNAPQERFDKEKKLIAAKWVYPQAKEYSDYLWKWRHYQDEQKDPSPKFKKRNTLGAFAFSTAIEHMYLRLDNAEHGLVKVVHDQ